jgi:hypothetical protein
MKVKTFFMIWIFTMVLGAVAGGIAVGIEKAVQARQGIKSFLIYKGV